MREALQPLANTWSDVLDCFWFLDLLSEVQRKGKQSQQNVGEE